MECSDEMGALQFLPGSHRRGMLGRGFGYDLGELEAEYGKMVDPTAAQPLALGAPCDCVCVCVYVCGRARVSVRAFVCAVVSLTAALPLRYARVTCHAVVCTHRGSHCAQRVDDSPG